MTADTLAFADLYDLLAAQITGFTAADGASLASLGCALYARSAPDDRAYPYGTLRLYGFTSSVSGLRHSGLCEVQLYGRPRSMAQTIEQCGDVVQAALLQFRTAASGLVFSFASQRDTLPGYTEPADREVYGIRLLFPVTVWPRYLTRYDAP